MPAWLAPIAGAAVGAVVGLTTLDRDPDHWKEFSLAFAGIGFVAGLIMFLVDLARTNPQITPTTPPPLPVFTFPVRPFKPLPLPRPSQTFVVSPRTGVFAAAGAVLALLGAGGLFTGLSFLFGWITPHDGRSPLTPGLLMTLVGLLLALFGAAQLSISLVRARPVLIAYREGIAVRIPRTSPLDDIPIIPDYIGTLVEFFTRTPWQSANIVLAWQTLHIATVNATFKHTLLSAGQILNTATSHAGSPPYQIELDEADLGTDVDNLCVQLQHIAGAPDVQQTLPPLPTRVPSISRDE